MKGLRNWLPVLAVLSLVLLGSTSRGAAWSPESLEFGLAQADIRFVGEQEQDWAAYSVSPAGDVNGDGYDDLLVGAPMAGNKRPGDPPKGEGKVYLILGRPRHQWPAGPINLAQADASFLGCAVGSMTGRQNYTAGDVNGDGYDDLLISGWKCSHDKPLQGKAYLFLGRPDADWGQEYPVEQADASFVGEGEGDHAAYYVHTAGDVDGDGHDDLLIAAPHNSEAAYMAGQVYLILGRPQADWGSNYSLAEADASFLGEAAEDRAGRSAAGAGDVNGDGYADWLVGSILNDEGGESSGQSYLILGRAAADWGMDFPLAQADASFVGEAAGDESGRRVAGAGDVNGDGYDDLLIAASRNDQAGADAGKAYLILGRPAAGWGMGYSLAQADASFLGEAAGDQAGRRVSGVGDYNRDGFADFVVGAPHNSRGGDTAGAAYLLLGRAADGWGQSYPLAQADMVYVGEEPVDVAGYDVAPAGDVDGDGTDDFVVGAYGGRLDAGTLDEDGSEGAQSAGAGKAYVLLSHAGEPPGPPVLLSPRDGTVTRYRDVTFRWQAGTGGMPLSFKIRLDDTVRTTAHTTWLAHLEPGIHTWRVRAANVAGASAWTEEWAVEVADVPIKVYVGNITMNYRLVPAGYRVQAMVPIWDEEGHVSVGAAVTAEWTLPSGQTRVQTALTTAKGWALFSRTAPQEGAWRIAVLDVQKEGYQYDPGLNEETAEEITVP